MTLHLRQQIWEIWATEVLWGIALSPFLFLDSEIQRNFLPDWKESTIWTHEYQRNLSQLATFCSAVQWQELVKVLHLLGSYLLKQLYINISSSPMKFNWKRHEKNFLDKNGELLVQQLPLPMHNIHETKAMGGLERSIEDVTDEWIQQDGKWWWNSPLNGRY